MRNHILLNPEVRPVWGGSDEARLLAAYERVWERKAILRRLYETWYRQIAASLREGNVVEIGAGTGNFKRWLHPRRCWTLDILPGKHVDVQADALRAPLRRESLDNIVMIDTLHHIARPFTFLRRAADMLRPRGRVILVEPFVSVWGWIVWKFLHHERLDFDFAESDGAKEAWDGNAAIPRLVLAGWERERIPLRVRSVQYCEWLSYPLSGGFSYRSLLPGRVLLALHSLERTALFQNRWVSLRVVAVLEKPLPA